MDLPSLALMAINLITPYLIKIGEETAKEVGGAAFDGAKQILSSIRKKIKGDEYASQTLKRLEQEPGSNTRQAALAGVLEEKLKEDALFAAELQKILEETGQLTGDTINQQVTVSGRARTGNIQVVGKVEGGSVNMGGKP